MGYEDLFCLNRPVRHPDVDTSTSKAMRVASEDSAGESLAHSKTGGEKFTEVKGA